MGSSSTKSGPLGIWGYEKMKALLAVLSTSISILAYADVRFPTPENPTPEPEISTTSHSGIAAQNKYAALIGEEFRDVKGLFKVERSSEQIEQTVCHQRGQPSVFECIYKRSLNGKPLPRLRW